MKRPTLVLPTAAFLLASGPVLSKAVSRYPGLACRGLGSADLHLVLTRPGVDVPGEELAKDLAGWERDQLRGAVISRRGGLRDPES